MKSIKRILASVLIFSMMFTLIPTLMSNEQTSGAEAFSIKAPYNGQLVAAGYIDISWKTATGGTVRDYALYIDNEKITTTSSTTYEYYTTKVMAHEVYVEAHYTDGSTQKSATSTFGVSKKGLGLATDMGRNISLRDMGVAWYYNWGENPSSGDQYQGIEYVPMVWKETNANNLKNRVNNAKNKGYKYILTFNEPDLGNQCNMSVNDVVSTWQGLNDVSGIHVASPVTAQWPQNSPNWFQPFMSRISSQNLHDVDFITIHCYPDNYGGAGMASWFLTEVVDWTWNTYHKPIWITEFSTTGQYITATGNNGTKEFWEAVMPGLDEREYVERYAAFDFNDPKTGLWLYGNGQLTAAGEIYRDYGNPAGFTASEGEAPDYKTNVSSRNTVLDNNVTENNVVLTDYVNESGVTASASTDTGGNNPENAIDESFDTRWESVHGQDPQTFTLDLGTNRNIKRIDVLWEGASAALYKIEVSTDGSQYTEVAQVSSDTGARLDSTVLKQMVNARYIRINGIARTTIYGYSIRDIAVYGTDNKDVDITTPKPTTTPRPTTTKAPVTTKAQVTTTKAKTVTTKAPAVTNQKTQTTQFAGEFATSPNGEVSSDTLSNAGGGAASNGTVAGDASISKDEPTNDITGNSQKPKIKKVTKKKSAKNIKVVLKKKLTSANGYQVYVYKTKKNAKKNRKPIAKLTVKKNKKSFTVKSAKIKNKKTLFVRIRGYQTIDGTKHYGQWSAVKKIKIKK